MAWKFHALSPLASWILALLTWLKCILSTRPLGTPPLPYLHSSSSPMYPSVAPLGLVKKTLVLDLDETLVHSTSRPSRTWDLVLEVYLDQLSVTFYVRKRPHAEMFLRRVLDWYDVVVFTASLRKYADPLIDLLDRSRRVQRRMFRDSCLKRDGNYVKDLSRVSRDLSNVIIVDNSPIAFSDNQENAIPIAPWYDSDTDEALLDLLPILDALRFVRDVRSVLSLRVRADTRTVS